MMIELDRAVERVQSEGGELVRAVVRHRYDTPPADLWEALTDPDRMKRWFYPLSGDLREGGTFQLEGNAGGDILACDPPTLLKLTFGGPASIVVLRLTEAGGGTTLELEHTVPIEMAGSGAGALFVGPGWDGAFLALDFFVAGEVADDPIAAASSPEALEFSRQSVALWTATVEASGTATADEIAAAREMSQAQFAPESGAAG
jgi:uncharacterized protein YndB with AHSA1/START domain